MGWIFLSYHVYLTNSEGELHGHNYLISKKREWNTIVIVIVKRPQDIRQIF